MYVFSTRQKGHPIISDCTNVPLNIILSEAGGCKCGNMIKLNEQLRTTLDTAQACSAFELVFTGNEHLSCNVTVQYKQPKSGTIISTKKEFILYNQLKIISPVLPKPDNRNACFHHMT